MSIQLFGKKKLRRQQVLILTSSLNRWCQVKADILFAFEQSLFSSLDGWLKEEIKTLLIRTKGGMSIDAALSDFAKISDQENFQDLIIALRTNIKKRGNLPLLLENLEYQFFQLEEVCEQRKILNKSDFKVVFIGLIISPAIFFGRMIFNQHIFQTFLEQSIGLFLLTISASGYLLGIFLFCKAVKKISF